MARFGLLGAVVGLAALAAPLAAQPARQSEVDHTLAAWTVMWNRYDLDQVDRLFVTDSSLTYFSSERDGLLQGMEALRAHHTGFGFVPGGKDQPNQLLLESVVTHWQGATAVVLATWIFRRADGSAQKGPVTFVLVPRSDGYRIAHAHFANAPPAPPR
ncbi:MAG: hypothetical protein AABY91_04720 [Gemmatimonadota bacterium]